MPNAVNAMTYIFAKIALFIALIWGGSTMTVDSMPTSTVATSTITTFVAPATTTITSVYSTYTPPHIIEVAIPGTGTITIQTTQPPQVTTQVATTGTMLLPYNPNASFMEVAPGPAGTPVPPPPPTIYPKPTCTLTADWDTILPSGDQVAITWQTANATDGTLQQSNFKLLMPLDPIAAGTIHHLDIGKNANTNTLFTASIEGPGGTTTCSTSINAK